MSILPAGAALVFACAGYAEVEVRRAVDAGAKLSRSDQATLFLLLIPTRILAARNSQLYRCHARELIARFLSGDDLRPGTKAEAMCVLHDSSLIAPLGRNAQSLYERLFVDVYGADRAREVLGEDIVSEAWPRGAEETLVALRRRCQVESRTADTARSQCA